MYCNLENFHWKMAPYEWLFVILILWDFTWKKLRVRVTGAPSSLHGTTCAANCQRTHTLRAIYSNVWYNSIEIVNILPDRDTEYLSRPSASYVDSLFCS